MDERTDVEWLMWLEEDAEKRDGEPIPTERDLNDREHNEPGSEY